MMQPPPTSWSPVPYVAEDDELLSDLEHQLIQPSVTPTNTSPYEDKSFSLKSFYYLLIELPTHLKIEYF